MADAPRCRIMVTGESFDICCIGSVDPSGELMLFPHETAYKVDEAFEKFAAYLKQVSLTGESQVDALDLLRHQKTTGVVLALMSESMLLVNGNLYEVPGTRKIKKNFNSDFIYGKLEAIMPRVKMSQARAADSAQVMAARAVEGPSMVTMGGPKPAPEEAPRRDPAARKPMLITTVTQGSGAQDALASKLSSLEKELGVRPGHNGGGLKEATIMSVRKNGAVLMGLNAMTDDEITERDSMALSGGGRAPAEPSAREQTTHIAIPREAPSAAPDPIDFDFGEEASAPVAAAPKAAAQRPKAAPVTTLTGDEAERLAATTSALSETGQQALAYQRVESRAADEVGDVVEDFFVNHTERGQLAGQDADALADRSQSVVHGGRNVVKAGVDGTGRGGKRPTTDRDKARAARRG